MNSHKCLYGRCESLLLYFLFFLPLPGRLVYFELPLYHGLIYAIAVHSSATAPKTLTRCRIGFLALSLLIGSLLI